MSSSISSSDAVRTTEDASPWGRCIAAFLAALAIGGLALLGLMILVDPYDSGRFGLLGIRGTGDTWVAMAQASRAREPNFDSAVIGNSTAQLIKPETLSAATGRRFVQLFVPGALPSAQLAVMEFFLRHHAEVGAFVIVIDDPWCAHETRADPNDVFPYWLYEDSRLRYVGHLFTWRSIDLAARRISIALGHRNPEPMDGYNDYERDFPPGTQQPADTPQPQSPRFDGSISSAFPYRDRLADVLGRLPAEVPIVFVVPPNFYTKLPAQETRAARERTACNAAFRTLVAGRAHSNLVDYRIDNALTRDAANFIDLIHYRSAIAQRVNDGIIASLRDGEAARIDF